MENGVLGVRHRAVRKTRGFTLIELLIVVAIVGLVASIAIPNLINALDRAKQKRTMGDLRALSMAIEIYGIDHSQFPTAADIAALRAIVDPIYLKQIPMRDGWSHDFLADVSATSYTVGSSGKDGIGGLTACAGAPMCGNLNDSIIFSNGRFVQWPDGIQR